MEETLLRVSVARQCIQAKHLSLNEEQVSNQSMASFDLMQVKPSSKLDPCLSQMADVARTLTSFVTGKGNKLAEFLKKGNTSQAATLARSVLKSSNEKTGCGRTLDKDTKTLVRAMISQKKKNFNLNTGKSS